MRSQSPPSPSDHVLNQLVKGCQLAMHNTILLAKENKELHNENKKKKQKHTQSRRQIPAEAGLSVQEASQLITELVEVIEAPPPGASIHGELTLQPHTSPPLRMWNMQAPRT